MSRGSVNSNITSPSRYTTVNHTLFSSPTGTAQYIMVYKICFFVVGLYEVSFICSTK